jgi:hypothetical protein
MSSERSPHRRLARRPARALLTLAVFAFAGMLASCGKKGAPMPPPSRLPKPADDLQVEQWGETVRLEFSYPTETVGGMPLSGIKAVEVWEVVRPFIAQPAAPAATPAASTGTEGAATESTETSGTTTSHHGRHDEATEQSQTDGTEQPQATTAESTQESQEAQAQAVAEEPSPLGPLSTTVMPPPTPTIASADFKANANQLTTIEGDELKAAILGDKILLTFPASSLHELPPPPEPKEGETATPAKEPAVETSPEPSEEQGEKPAAPASAVAETAPAESSTAASAATQDEMESTGTEGAEATEEATPKPTVEEVHFLAVRTTSEAGKTSDFSRVTYLVAGTPPTAPTNLRATATEGGIALVWTFPEETEGAERTGVQIYRRTRNQSVFTEPLTTLPANAVRYVDRTAQFGRKYIYAISAVGRETPLLQSALSDTAEVDYADIYEPQRPARLDLFTESTRVRLIWEAPASPDIAGYRIERAGADGHFAILNTELVTTPEYIDHDVDRGATYSYRVVAIDTAGNASDPSPVETTRIP